MELSVAAPRVCGVTIPLSASPGIHLVVGAFLADVVEPVTRFLLAPRDDPFAMDLVVAPDAAHGRLIAQQLAPRLGGDAGDGIAAGITFASWASFRASVVEALTGVAPSDQPWRSDRLQWSMLQVLDAHADQAWVQPVLANCPLPGQSAARPGRRAARARYLASLFTRYLHECPESLAAWAAGGDDVPADVAWQPPLWRAVLARVGQDPVQLHQQMVRQASDAPIPGLPATFAILAPPRVGPPDHDLLLAIARHHDVRVGVVDPRRRGIPIELAHSLGGEADALVQQWRGLASDVIEQDSAATWAPRTVDHVCHGPDRQIEVLRDALLREFDADATLEPRDVVIHCPDLETFAPHLLAGFHPSNEDTIPGTTQLRLRISDTTLRSVNPVFATLDRILALPSGRATRSELLEICADPLISTTFGFDDEDRLQRLTEHAEITWGIDRSHRLRHGVHTPHGTWSVGVDRLLAGVGLSADRYAPVGTALPVDDVSSDDTRLIGRLAEFTFRMTVLSEQLASQRSMREWCGICRGIIEEFLTVPNQDGWQLAHALSELADLAESAGDDSSPLALGDLRVILSQHASTLTTRSAVGTGSMLVCGDQSLVHAPRKVTVLLGYDDSCYPRRDPVSGDDLTLRLEQRQLPAPHHTARLCLLTAATAAPRLLVIHQGATATGNKPVPTAGPLEDVFRFLPTTSLEQIRNTLQPFSPHNFSGVLPRSHDRLAAEAAAVTDMVPSTRPYLRQEFAIAPRTSWAVEDLVRFFANPCNEFLRERAGIRLYRREGRPDTMPLSQDGLAQWGMTNRILSALDRGWEPDEARSAELLSGSLPPGDFVLDALGNAQRKAIALHRRGAEWRTPPPTEHSISVDLDRTGVRGVVRTHGDVLVTVSASTIKPKHILPVWIRLLALSATHAGSWTARLLGPRHDVALGPIPSQEARGHLDMLVRWAEVGRRRPLPWSTTMSFALAEALDRGVGLDDPWLWNHEDLRTSAWQRESAALRSFWSSPQDLFTDEHRTDDELESADLALHLVREIPLAMATTLRKVAAS